MKTKKTMDYDAWLLRRAEEYCGDADEEEIDPEQEKAERAELLADFGDIWSEYDQQLP